MKPVRLAFVLLLITLCAGAVLAQVVAPAKSGTVHYIEGAVYLDTAKIAEPIIAQFPTMKENSVLKTEEGRAETLMNPGLTLRLGENSSIRMLSTPFTDTRVELLSGSVTIQITETLKDTNFTLALRDATVLFGKSGFVHIDADPARVRVYTGSVAVRLNGKSVEVSSGKAVEITNGALSEAKKFDKEYTEALDRWSVRRGETLARANAASARDCNSFIGRPCDGGWTWNRTYGMLTYIPFGAQICDPFLHYCYYSPRGYYSLMHPVYSPPMDGGMMGPRVAAPTSTGYSGAGAAAASSVSAPSAGTGSSAAAASSSSSVGQGSAGGSRGR